MHHLHRALQLVIAFLLFIKSAMTANIQSNQRKKFIKYKPGSTGNFFFHYNRNNTCTDSLKRVEPVLVSKDPLIIDTDTADTDTVENQDYDSLCDNSLIYFTISAQNYTAATISIKIFACDDLLCNVLSLLNLEDLINFSLMCKECYNYCNTFIQKSLSRLNVQTKHFANPISKIYKMILVSEFSELYIQAFPSLFGKKVQWADMTGLLAIALNSAATIDMNVTKNAAFKRKSILLKIINDFSDFTSEILHLKKELKTISKQPHLYSTIALVRSIQAGTSSFYNNQNNFNVILAHSMVSQHEILMKYLIEHNDNINDTIIKQSIMDCPRLDISLLLHKSLENKSDLLLKGLQNSFKYNNGNLLHNILKYFPTAFHPKFQKLLELIVEPELDSKKDLFGQFCQVIRSQRILLGAEYHENTHFTKYDANPLVNVQLYEFDSLIFEMLSKLDEESFVLRLIPHFPNLLFHYQEKEECFVFEILSNWRIQNKLDIPDCLKYYQNFNFHTVTVNLDLIRYIFLFTIEIQYKIINFLSDQIKNRRVLLGAQYEDVDADCTDDIDIEKVQSSTLLQTNTSLKEFDEILLNSSKRIYKIHVSMHHMIMDHIFKRPLIDLNSFNSFSND